MDISEMLGVSEPLSRAERLAEHVKGLDQMEQPRHKGDPEAVCQTLADVAARYGACAFAPGQMVTPRRGYHMASAGSPHVVLEVFDPPVRVGETSARPEECGSSELMAMIDMRVATNYHGRVLAFAVESWKFEEYELPVKET